MYNFNEEVDRRDTNCAKYDALDKYFGTDDLQPLWVADMDFKVCLDINEAILKKVEHGVYGYAISTQKTLNLIKNWMKKRHDFNIQTNHITMVNGVVPAYSAAIEAYSNEGDEIIVQTPVYFPLFNSIKNNNRVILKNPLLEKDGYYTMDLEHLESIITAKTKILTLCSPHNPVGRVWSKEELEKLANICIKNNIKIIVDEIHADLVFKKFTALASISDKISNITITLNSAGKTFNIAGLNCAYAICSNKQMKDDFDKIVQKREIGSINSIGLASLEAAYSFGDIWLEELLVYLENNINITKEYLKNTQITFKKPEATYLLWLNFSKFPISHNKVKDKLLSKSKLALNDGITFGKEGKSYFRLNIALQEKQLKIALGKMVTNFT